MPPEIETLTDREKETLRLVLRGHDAKSMARELDLSVHTINERLRHARRKLEVTSSREAARMLLDAEEDTPQLLVPKELGGRPGGGEGGSQCAAKAGNVPGPQDWRIGRHDFGTRIARTGCTHTRRHRH